MATARGVSDCCRVKRRVAIGTVIAAILSVWVCPQPMMAQDGTPSPAAGEAVARLRQAVAPGGIGTVTWPDQREGMALLMTALPSGVAGEPRARPPVDVAIDRLRVTYGEVGPLGSPLVVQALDVASGDFYPSDWTGVEAVALLASESADGMVEASGTDGEVTWVVGRTTASMASDPGTPPVSQDIFTVAWAAGDSPWMFSVATFSPEGRDALLQAVVDAARLGPATPMASPASATPDA